MSADIEAKRQRKKAMVNEMIALYCRKKHSCKRRPVSRLRRSGGLRSTAERPLSLYGDQDLLFQL